MVAPLQLAQVVPPLTLQVTVPASTVESSPMEQMMILLQEVVSAICPHPLSDKNDQRSVKHFSEKTRLSTAIQNETDGHVIKFKEKEKKTLKPLKQKKGKPKNGKQEALKKG